MKKILILSFILLVISFVAIVILNGRQAVMVNNLENMSSEYYEENGTLSGFCDHEMVTKLRASSSIVDCREINEEALLARTSKDSIYMCRIFIGEERSEELGERLSCSRLPADQMESLTARFSELDIPPSAPPIDVHRSITTVPEIKQCTKTHTYGEDHVSYSEVLLNEESIKTYNSVMPGAYSGRSSDTDTYLLAIKEDRSVCECDQKEMKEFRYFRSGQLNEAGIIEWDESKQWTDGSELASRNFTKRSGLLETFITVSTGSLNTINRVVMLMLDEDRETCEGSYYYLFNTDIPTEAICSCGGRGL